MNVMNIKGPDDIKNLNKVELNELAEKIRKFLVDSIAKKGGHLGSNLGIVELTMALHKEFNSPEDKLIFDVGHQGYVHKILTGRAKDFDTLRQYQGLSGFLKMNESRHDVWEAGHSSTSISAACGFAYARDIQNDDNHVVAIIGDGSLTNGMAIEALNHIVELNQKVIIIINDNEMSISNNVGFIDNILRNLQLSQGYDATKSVVNKELPKLPGGKTMVNFLHVTKGKLKQELNGAKNFFNLMGYSYLGVVDGHDFNDLEKNLKLAKSIDGPVIVHVKTVKGKGYGPTEKNQQHSTGPFDVQTGNGLQTKKGLSYSGLVAQTINNKMKKDDDVVVITPAMLEGSELTSLLKNYPNRVTDVGIAEEHAITFAGGLALAGKKPFVAIYSTFLQRTYDQIFHDLVRQNTNVVIGIDRAGLVGSDGETHQGIYDISFLSHMPNITITMGKDGIETRSLVKLGFEVDGVYAIRYPRGGSFDKSVLNEPLMDIEYQTWEELSSGEKGYVIAYGPVVNELADHFKADDNIGVINARFIKPFDEKMLMKIKNKKLHVVEEHTRLGGLNNLILDYYNQNQVNVDIKVTAFNDIFVEQGTPELLKEESKLTTNQVIEITKEYINGKN